MGGAAVRVEYRVLRRCFALEVCGLHEHVPPGRVADGEDMGNGGAKVLVHGNRRSSGSDPGVLEAEVVDIRWPAGGHDHGIEDSGCRGAALPPAQRDRTIGAAREAVNPVESGMHGDPLLNEGLTHRFGDRRIRGHEYARRDVENGDSAAEGAENGHELGAGVAGTDHGETGGELGQEKKILRHGSKLGAGDGKSPRVPTDADDHGLGRDDTAAVEHQGVRIGESRSTLEDQLDTGCVEPLRLGLDRPHAVDGAVHPGDGLGPVE